MKDVYLTPTEREAQALEIAEKGCRVCRRRIWIKDSVRCQVGKQFPKCRKQKGGFLLEDA